MTPIEVYKTYLAFKNHFTKKNYDYFKYCGKTNASRDAFNKRKDRYFFERMSRKKTDEEIRHYFLARHSLKKISILSLIKCISRCICLTTISQVIVVLFGKMIVEC